MRRGQFVFVSHASRDKPRIRFLVDALLEAGLGVWLDDPEALGFTAAEVKQKFQNLRPGQSWRSQIQDALEASKCVLACCTETFWQRYHAGGSHGHEDSVVREEIAQGRAKLVMCRLDGFDMNSVPAALSNLQFADLHTAPGGGELGADALKARLATLVEAVRAMMQRTSELQLGSAARADPRTRLGPYLIDRETQEAAARKAIRAAAEGSVHAFFVAGPEDECLDQFRSRLRHHTTPICLANGRSWEELLVRWPLEAGPAEFEDAYADALAAEWRIPPQRLGEHLAATRDTPLAPVSVIAMGDWQRNQKQTILAWLRFWKARTPAGAKVVPVLAVEMAEARRAWKGMPPGRANGVSAKRVWDDVGAALALAQKQGSGAVPFQRLDLLHPVNNGHGRHWARDMARDAVGEDGQYEILSKGVEQVLKKENLLGVPMKEFADKIDPHWRKAMQAQAAGHSGTFHNDAT